MNNLLSSKKLYTCLFWLLFLNIHQYIFSQSNITYYDSIINTTSKDSVKIPIIESWINSNFQDQNTLELGNIYDNFSKFCYKRKHYKKAIYNANQALKIQKKFIDTLPQLVNKTYNNLSVFYKKDGQTDQAFATLKKLTTLAHKDKYTVIAYTNGLKNHALQRGDYYQALDYIREAEQIIDNSKSESLRIENYRIPIAYSGVFLKLGGENNLKKALLSLQQADTLNTLLAVTKKQTQNHIIIHNRFGQVYSSLKNYDKAIYHFKEALDTSLLHQKNYYQIATIQNNLGVNYFKLGLVEKALEAYKQALEYEPKYTATYDNLGDYYVTVNKYEQALLQYQKAIDYNVGIYKNHDFHLLPERKQFENSDVKTELLNDLKDKANAWLLFYKTSQDSTHLENALTTVEMADYLVDLIRLESVASKSRFFWRAKEIDLYMLATSIAYELKDHKKAFYFMEKSKSLALLENLTHEEAKKRAQLPDSLINREYILKKNIFITRQRLEKESTISENEKQHTIYNTQKQYRDFINSLETKYPNYYKYKKEIGISTYDAVVNTYKNSKTSILQYIISDKKGYGILISPSYTSFFEIKDLPALHSETKAMGALLNTYWETEEDQQRFNTIARSIYNKLFPFDVQKLKEISQNLIVIPDYILQYIPFEVLISSQKEASDIRYLLHDFDVNYLYSMSLHKQVLQKKREVANFFLGMAPVKFTYLNLPDLSLSVSKIESFKKELDADVFVYKEASKSNFIKNSTNYKILHLSSHASSLDTKTPWIAFSDNKLTLNELYFIPNNADIVVLDACKTGIGELQIGESSLSLTRGFFHSGAKSVVSSLWNTNEKSNSEIITNFYSYLKQGIPKSKALRKAKLDFINTHQGSEQSPYYWGALILTGDNGTIEIPQNLRNYWMIGFAIIAVILLVIFLFRKKYHSAN